MGEIFRRVAMISPVVPGERAQLPTASPNASRAEDPPADAPEDAAGTTTATPTSEAVARYFDVFLTYFGVKK